MKKHVLSLMAVALLAGCAATKQEMDHEAALIDKQLAAQDKKVVVPIFSLEAIEGQTISMSGVKSIRVYDPSANAPVPQIPVRKTGAEVAWDGVTKTLGILANPLFNWAIHKDSQNTARKQIDANVETQRINMGTVSNVAIEGFNSLSGVATTGIEAATKPPIVVNGTVAPAAPATEAPATTTP